MTAPAAVRIAGEVGGVGRFAVESGSHDGLAYVLTVSAGMVIKCDCLAGKAQRLCRHAREVREALNAEPRPELVDVLGASVNALMRSRAERVRKEGVTVGG